MRAGGGAPLPAGWELVKEGTGVRGRLAAIALLTLVIYGRHLGDGYLADDFLFLSWWQEGIGELLRRVTVDANPRVIRPLPALAWGLSELPGGAVIHHGLSLLVHATTAWFVARITARRSGSREIGWLAGMLFVSFPLFTEPVIWLSAAPDLWACLLALAALDAALPRPPAMEARGTGGGAPLPVGRERVGEGTGVRAAILFALSLLCKESTVMLPLILLCLAPWQEIRRPFVALSAVALGYLGVRLLLFGGLGGYLGSEGQALALDVDPVRFLRNLMLQVPYRLLIPLKRAGELAPWLGLISAVLGLAAIAGGRPWRQPGIVAKAVVVAVLSAVPVAAFFSVDFDHENSRMLYFPVAVVVVGLAAAVSRATLFRVSTLAMIVFWSVVAAANGRSWSQGSREVEQTLAVMNAAQQRFPTGATVLIAGHDTWQGAYVWRNGLAFAARRHGLRDDLYWTLGTAAVLPQPQDLGHTVFEIGVGADGRERDWTACQEALWTESLSPLGQAGFAAASQRLDSGPIGLRRPSSTLAVEILAEPNQRFGGRLWWRHDGIGRFNITDSRRFELFPGNRRSVVRLPDFLESLHEIELRIETAAPVREVRVVESADDCR